MPEPIVAYHHMEDQFQTLENILAPEMKSLLLECMEDSSSLKKTAAKIKHDPYVLRLIEEIYNHPDQVLTATHDMVNQRRASESEEMYMVPSSVNGTDLLNLKAAGYVLGQGRGVSLTVKGQEALRDHWLVKTNALVEKRTKSEFVHPWRTQSRTASSEPLKRFKH